MPHHRMWRWGRVGPCWLVQLPKGGRTVRREERPAFFLNRQAWTSGLAARLSTAQYVRSPVWFRRLPCWSRSRGLLLYLRLLWIWRMALPEIRATKQRLIGG